MLRKRITAAAAAFMLMTGCGSYDFANSELSQAMGISRSEFDKMKTQPDSDGHTGNALMEEAMALGNADCYTYWLEQGNSSDSYDVAELFFYGGKVTSVKLMTYNAEKSEHMILGIRVGDSRASAEEKAEKFFGAKGKATSDNPELWRISDKQTDFITYGGASGKKGTLYLSVDIAEDRIYKIEYSG